MATSRYNPLQKEVVIRSFSIRRLAWPLAVGAAGAAYFVFFFASSLVYFERMMFEDFDLAVHAQTLWKLSRGAGGHSSILGIHFLGNHFTPAFYLLQFGYRLWPSPVFLLALQTLAIAASGFLAFRTARRFVPEGWAALVAAAFYLHPATGFANLFEFHPTTLAVPFLFLATGAFLDGRLARFLVWSAAAMAFQENIPLATLFFVPLAWAERRPGRWALWTGTLAAGWLVAAVGFGKPFFDREGTIDFFLSYSHLGGSARELLFSPFLRPEAFWGKLFSKETGVYFFQLIVPFALLPLLGGRWLLPALPFFLQHALSLRTAERAMTYHYAAELLPFLSVAAAAGLRRALSVRRGPALSVALAAGWAAAVLQSFAWLSPFTTARSLIASVPEGPELEAKRKMVARIPPEASVTATFEFLPSLANRREVYSAHHEVIGLHTLSRRLYRVPEADYALVNLRDPKAFGYDGPNARSNARRFFTARPWEVVDHYGDTLLLKRGRADLDAILRAPRGGEEPQARFEAAAGALVLEGVTVRMPDVSFFWRVDTPMDEDAHLALFLVDANELTAGSYVRPIGYRIFPTSSWQAGTRVVETYRVPLPQRLSEGTELRAAVVIPAKETALPFASPEKGRIDERGRARVAKVA